MLRKILSIAFILVAVTFGAVGSVSAEESPEVTIKDVEIQKNTDSVVIFATILNSSQTLETSPFTYLAMLKSINHFIPSSDPELDLPALIVAAVEGGEYMTLKPLEEKRVSYLIPISPDLPKDNYDLNLNLLLKDGRTIGYFYDVVEDYGANRKEGKTYKQSFLAFDQESCVVARADGLTFPANEGPIFEPNEEPIAKCSVKNIGSEDAVVYPVTIWKEFFVYGRPSSGQRYYEKSVQPVTIKAGESKIVEVVLPGEEDPQVYQALVSFEDSQGVKKSFDMFFRWTIKGESGRVQAVSLVDAPKANYKTGEIVALSVDYYGPTDLYWSGIEETASQSADFSLSAVIKNESGDICGQKIIKLPAIEDGGLKNEVADVELSRNCSNISYDVSLVSEDGDIIAQEADKLPVKSNPIQDVKNYLYAAAGLVLIALLALILLITKKKKSLANVYVLAMVLATACFFGVFGNVSAETRTHTGIESPSSYGGEAFTSNDNANSSDKLYSTYTGGNNEMKIKNVYAYFDNYFANTGKPYVHFDYGAGYGGSCSNSAMYIRMKMELQTGGSTYNLKIRKKSSSGGYEGKYIKEIIGSANSDRDLNLEIQADEFAYMYDSNGNLKSNSNLIVYITSISRHAQGGTTPEGAYYRSTFKTPADKTQYSARNDALDASDVIKIIIPLSGLKSPAVDLNANPTEIDSGGNTTLSWTTTGVDSCTASASPTTGLQWVGNVNTGTGSKVIKGLTQDTTFRLNCSAYLGSATGNKNYSDTANVTMKANQCDLVGTPAVSSFTANGSSAGSVEINSGDSVTFAWAGNGNSTDCVFTATGLGMTDSRGTPVGLYTYDERDASGSKKISNITAAGSGSVVCYNTTDRKCAVSDAKTINVSIKGVPTDGSCDSTKNSCLTGTFSDTADSSTEYKWQCIGINGGVTKDCSATIGGGGGGGGGGGDPPSITTDPTKPSNPGGNSYTLTVNIEGTGEGNVKGNGIDCSAGNSGTCSVSIAEGTSVVLTETPGLNSVFSSWSGACGDSSATCSFAMSSNTTSVTATFTCSGSSCDPGPRDGVPSDGGGGCTSGCDGSDGGGGAPSVPSLTGSSSGCYIVASWTNTGDSYYLERSIDSESDVDYVSIYSGTNTSYNDSISSYVGSGYTFRYRVKACNSNGCSAYSSVSSVSVPSSCDSGYTPPPASSDLSLSADGNLLATVLDNLPADSNEINITTSGSCSGNISLSAVLPSAISEATSEFSSPTIITGGTSSFRIKSIPGATVGGEYTVTIKGTGSNCSNDINVPINIEKVTTIWEEI